MTDRVIVLVDMDCFYCQVETKLNPSLAGKPVAVVQYNAWKGGGIIAVNYEARDKGVTRGMRGNDAKKHCPDIELVSVATIRDKADLTKYRDASREVISVLCTYSNCVERASIDEAYLDLTESVQKRQPCESIKPNQISNTFIVGYSKEKCNHEEERAIGMAEWINDIYSSGLNDESSKNLAIAARIVEQIRLDVYSKTGYLCSAGIAHNKILAKLACGLHKPNRQTVLPHSSVPHLYQTLSIKKVRHLGGKLGDLVMERLNCSVMADLLKYSERDLVEKFDEKNGLWLYNIARGIDEEAVQARLIPKSIGCCKRFPGRTALKTKEDVSFWLSKLTEELTERILEDQTMNKRKAQLLTVSMTLTGHQATSKSIPLNSYDYDRIYNTSYLAIRKIVSDPKEQIWSPIYCLGLSASKFMDKASSGGISSFFQTDHRNISAISVEPANKSSGDTNGFKVSASNSFFSKFITSLPSRSADRTVVPEKRDPTCHELKRNQFNENPVESDVSDPIRGKVVSDAISSESSSSSTVIETVSVVSNVQPNKQHTSDIKSFFRKNYNSETGSSDSGVKVKSPKKQQTNSISDFLKNRNEIEIINPLDVFPDLNMIDDEMLESFPISFRRRVLELKKTQTLEENKITHDSKTQSSDICQNISIQSSNDFMSENPSSSKDEDLVKSTSNSVQKQIYDNEDIFDKDEITVDTSPPEKTSKYFPALFEKCSECGLEMDKESYPEHLDFHLAEKINKEINPLSAPVTSVVRIQKLVQTSVGTTKRKQSHKGGKICNSKKLKTLNKFFGS